MSVNRYDKILDSLYEKYVTIQFKDGTEESGFLISNKNWSVMYNKYHLNFRLPYCLIVDYTPNSFIIGERITTFYKSAVRSIKEMEGKR